MCYLPTVFPTIVKKKLIKSSKNDRSKVIDIMEIMYLEIIVEMYRSMKTMQSTNVLKYNSDGKTLFSIYVDVDKH